jgi:2-acylglycerol O-acyltransferase 2
MSMVFFYGRWFLPIPHQSPILMVIGAPIPVPHIPHPTDEQVHSLHRRFMNEIQKLYDDHKHLVGWEHKTLHMV